MAGYIGNKAVGLNVTTGDILGDVGVGGDIDVDGTANLDVVDVDGAANFAADVTFADGADIITATAGTSNFRAGVNAGNSIASGGGGNVCVGDEAGTAITTGDQNTAVGAFSLKANITSSFNTAVGQESMLKTTGASNTALGDKSMLDNVGGANNVALGASALENNTTASNNTALGYQAGYTNTTGTGLTSLGYQAAYTQTTPNYNTAIGQQSLFRTTTGSNNAALGLNSMYENTTGSNNTAIGMSALNSNTTASESTAVGYQAGYTQTTSGGNTYVGKAAGYYTTGVSNTLIGQAAGSNITSGTKNTILGRYNGNQSSLDIRTASNNIVLSDGDGNPRAHCDSNADFYIGGVTTRYPGNGNTANGFMIEGGQRTVFISRASATALMVNRNSDDGAVVSIRQGGSEEGSISVSGTTVSYNGGHLARWSQLADNTRDDTLLKGTVLTNLDQMAVWGEEDNEQLNCMAKSSVEGDANVAGVFVNWDNDDDVYTNDMNIAMTGDMIIRIAQGTTVARGNLLMSAGDGTAKPQGDDIVRSKTIAKVTSTHVSNTYDDGSFCVPCVLMAC